jgi:predicted Co/Zn/Cd cation transporter (cation efflux family)
MTFFSLKISRLVSQPESRSYPVGFFAYESLFVLIKGASILVLIVSAVAANVYVMLQGGREPVLGLMTLYVALAVLGCIILYGITHRAAKATGLDMLRAEAQAWLVNAVVSGAIGLAFLGGMLLDNTPLVWLQRYIDQILVVLLGLLFVRDPLVLISDGFKELTLAAPTEDHVAPYATAFQKTAEKLGFQDLTFDVIKTGRRRWVTVRIIPREKTVAMDQLRAWKQALKQTAWSVYDNTECDVILTPQRSPA